MAASKDFLQDENGDLLIQNGRLVNTPDRITFAAQGLLQNLNFWEGERKLDTREGMPMFARVIGQKFDRGGLGAIYREACAKTLGVGSVDAVTFEYDNRDRSLRVFPQCRTVDGDEIPDVGPFIIQSADL